MSDTTTNRYLTGCTPRCRPSTRRSTWRSPAAPGRARRPVPPQRAEPDRAGRSGQPPLVHRQRDGPRRAPARRQGRLVPEPLDPLHPRSREALGEEPAPGDRNGGNESANTNVIGHAGRTFAIVEAGGRPVELTEELETVCFSDFDGTLAHGFTAHPKRDPRTGSCTPSTTSGPVPTSSTTRSWAPTAGWSTRSTSRCRATR